MTYGLAEYAGGLYGGSRHGDAPSAADTQTALSIEVAFTTGALETPVWVDITVDVRSWDVQRGRWRELERFQPGRATIVLGNLSRQYDAVYAAGPHFGDLRPMRRVRIRETFNGVTYPVFDGFVDRWQLDYPAVGKDATATLTATDAIKIFARTDLPLSVYRDVVEDDAPDVWLPLDDVQTIVDTSNLVLNHGSNPFDASTLTSAGEQEFGAQGLITHDPGDACEFFERTDENIQTPYTLNATGAFTIELWFRLSAQPTATNVFMEAAGTGSAGLTVQLNHTTMKMGFVYTNNAGGAFSAQPNTVINVGQRYHITAVHDGARLLGLYFNGVLDGTGTRETTTGATDFDSFWVGSAGTAASPLGTMAHFAVYDRALSADEIAEHYAAGSTPWQGDDPSDRLGRILDLSEWPDELRELSAGSTTLQSATLGTTALEHAQKVGETERGLLFINRAGEVVLRDQAWQAARVPDTTVYGDEAGEIGYRAIRPDDGDEVIRNQATISRLNGVAQTATGTTVDEFGRFQYTLDGLLHDTDAYSATYAQFIVDEYENPRRRIVELTIGPPPDGDEDLYYPAMLGPELGDAITVRFRPSGVGAGMEQICVIEGIRHGSAPGRNRTITFTLSPELGVDGVPVELAGALLAEDGDTLITESGDTLTLES